MRPVLANFSHDQSKCLNWSAKSNFRPAFSRTRMPSGTTSRPMPSPSITAILRVGPLGMVGGAPGGGGRPVATTFGAAVLAQPSRNANPFALADGPGRWARRRVGRLLLLHQVLLQEQLLLKLLRLVKLLLLLLDLELLVLLQGAQMVLRRFLLHQDRPPFLQVLSPQQIELRAKSSLAPILLRAQRLPFLLLKAPNRLLLQQAQLYLRVGVLCRNAQQNDKQQPLDHGHRSDGSAR